VPTEVLPGKIRVLKTYSLKGNDTNIILVEVKSGAAGSLKSLHQFISERNFKTAVRINSEKPAVTKINVKTSTGNMAKYSLISIPFSLTEEIDRFI